MRKWATIVLLALPFAINAQIITTFAGTGHAGATGDGGPAAVANIPHPCSGVFDRQGNYYFCEANNGYRVRKINTAGIITTVAGTTALGGYNGDGIVATTAQLNLPNGVTVDTAGNVFIADANNNRIRKVDVLTGIITTIAGNGTSGFFGDGMPATAAELSDPQGMCFDKAGNLYIADLQNSRVRKVNNSGIISTYAGTGVSVFSGDGGPATAACTTPWGVCVDDTGNLYIADLSFSRVRKINTFGIINTVAGTGSYSFSGDDIPATSANVDPGYISIDALGELYISDQSNQRVRKVDLSGIIHTVAGIGIEGHTGDGGPATAAKLAYPSGIAFDTCGNIYIADDDSNYIRKIIVDTPCYTNNPALKISQVNANFMVSVYPNPAYNSITISATNKMNQITITNLIGQIVYTQTLDIEKAEVNVAGLPEGVYIVKVTDNEGRITVSKIVKE